MQKNHRNICKCKTEEKCRNDHLDGTQEEKKSLNPTHMCANVYCAGDDEIPLPEYNIHDWYSDRLVHGEECGRPLDPTSQLDRARLLVSFFAFECHYHR